MTATEIAPLTVPLTSLPEGTLRVTGTRIGLHLIIDAYKRGETPEKIVEAFDSLRLADVYAVISYYLNHTNKVEAYLRKCDEDAKAIRRKIEAEMPIPQELRDRIRARSPRMEAEKDATARQ